MNWPGRALLKHWDISIQKDGSVQKNITARFMKGYVPLVSEADLHDDRILSDEKSEGRTLEDIEGLELGNLMTFGHIAAKARNQTDEGLFQGIQALGVLKADVDQLGMLMAAGIPPGMFSISRLAALSRQLDFFFCVYLPHLLKTDSRFQDIYTVFAGGDDLFLIGPWNRIIDLSLHLRKAFAWYVCANPRSTSLRVLRCISLERHSDAWPKPPKKRSHMPRSRIATVLPSSARLPPGTSLPRSAASRNNCYHGGLAFWSKRPWRSGLMVFSTEPSRQGRSSQRVRLIYTIWKV